MSEFDAAIPVILRHEGGYVDHPDDPGGATNYGISLRFLRSVGDLDSDGFADGDFDQDGDIDAADIRNMTEEQAIGFYYTHWWEKYRYGHINEQATATLVFDLAVNMGGRQAHKILQRSLRAVGATLKDDGILGPVTLRAVNACNQKCLRAAYRAQADGFYRMLAALKPDTRAGFLKGWLNRVHDNSEGD